MIPELRTIAAPKAMTFTGLLEKIRYEGAYPTRERAEEALSAVLGGLGAQITGEERAAFAASLPREAAQEFTRTAPGGAPVPAAGFVDALAARTGGTAATARWDSRHGAGRGRLTDGPGPRRPRHRRPPDRICPAVRPCTAHHGSLSPPDTARRIT